MAPHHHSRTVVLDSFRGADEGHLPYTTSPRRILFELAPRGFAGEVHCEPRVEQGPQVKSNWSGLLRNACQTNRGATMTYGR